MRSALRNQKPAVRRNYSWSEDAIEEIARPSPVVLVREPARVGRRLVSILSLLIFICIIVLSYRFYVTPPEQVIGFPEFATTKLPEMRGATLLPRLENKLFFKVAKGDSLQGLCENNGFIEATCNSLNDAVVAFNKAHDNVVLRAGDTLEVLLKKERIKSIRTDYKKSSFLLFSQSMEGNFSVEVVEQPKIKQERVAVGVITSSFADAAAKAGISYDIIDDLVDLFSDKVEFNKNLRRGDRFTVIYRDEMLPDGTSTGNHVILAAALSVNGKDYVAARYVGTDGKSRYFDDTGNALGNYFLRYPVRFTRISSVFSDSRLHPVYKIKRPHLGVDFAAPTGTPVRTIANGQVLYAGYKGQNGNMVKIKHNEIYTSVYLHLSKIAPGVRTGSPVVRGQVIGAVGSTGAATGPHLHFGFFARGKYVDPLKTKLPQVDLGKGNKISDVYLRRVLYTLEHYQTMELENSFWG